MRIPAAHIEPALKATDKYGAISELLHILFQVGAISRDSEWALCTAFRRREQNMTTGIGFGIAFPHIYWAGVTEPIAAFGRSLAGVDFDALDNNPVNLVFLSIAPADNFARDPARDSSLKFASRLAGGLTLPGTRTALRQCVTAQEIEAILDGF